MPATAPPAPEPSRQRRRERMALVALIGLTALVFATALSNGFAWDDRRLIRDNGYLADASRLPELLTSDFWHTTSTTQNAAAYRHAMYRPVVTFAFFLQRQLFGVDGRGFHAVNVLLHLAATFLAFRWLRRRLPEAPGTLFAAALGTALFALHPSRSEAVGWISASTDLWWTLFVLLGFEARAAGRPVVRVAVAAGCFVLALLSKETAACAAGLVLVDAWLLPEDRGGGRRKEAALVAGMVVVATGLRLALFPSAHGAGPVAVRALALLGAHASRFLEPVWPTVLVSLNAAGGGGIAGYDAGFVLLGAALVAIPAVVLLAGLRSPAWRPVAAEFAWVLLPLLPVAVASEASLFPVGDRYLYTSGLGAAALAGRAYLAAIARVPRLRLALAGSVLAVLAGFAVVTESTLDRFASTDALWAYEEALDPTNGYPVSQRAAVAADEGRTAFSVEKYFHAYELAPGRAEKAKLAIQCAEVLAEGTADGDQPGLLRLREFVDAALGVTGHPALLPTEAGTFELASGEGVHADGGVPPYLPITLHLRTGDAANAVEVARAWAEAVPAAVGARIMLARSLALAGDCPSALATAHDAQRGFPDDEELATAASRTTELCRLSSVPGDLPRRVRLMTELGSPLLAVQALAAAREAAPEDAALREEAARLEALMKQAPIAPERTAAK